MPRMLRGLAVLAVSGVCALAAWDVAERGQLASQPSRQPTGAAQLEDVAPDPAPSPRNASYSIDAELDPGRRALTGRGVLTWRNISPRETDELQLHLYWNAWRNNRSTWMRGLVRSGWTVPPADDAWGFIDVTAVRLLGGPSAMVDLTGSTAFHAPDDGNPHDRTVLRVPLPQPVSPGETVTIELAWTSRVPRTFSRTGVVGDFFFLAHWFPKVGVLESDGWNAHQFHVGTEFFSDFGVYDVRLTVPQGWVVGATGRERSRTPGPNGKTVHHYVQEDVHEFAWTASPRFLERSARFEHPTLPAVELRLLLQPEHAAQANRHFDAARAALRHFGEWFGPYPYGHLTIVDPAWQSGAEGMEYPTLITAGTRWLAPDAVLEPEDVVVHEAGHQFFYGVVATNEFEHAWLDEGLTTFATSRVLDEAFRPAHFGARFFRGFVPWVVDDFRLTREIDGDRLAGYRLAAESDVPATASWRYFPATGGAISYNKTALWLHTLERHIGWSRLRRGLSLYYQRHAFGHPAPDDLFAALNEGAGEDLSWFFDQVYRSSNVFDYGVERLTTDEDVLQGLPSGPARPQGGVDETPPHRTELVVRRYGEAVFPVEIRVTFADGTERRSRWDGRDRWKLLVWESDTPAVSAEVDPDRVLLLDVNRTNNSAAVEPSVRAAAWQWTARWLVWLQDLMLTYAAFV